VRVRTWLVAALLFGSGFCALVYQVAWLRDFRLIFGASTAASAAVVAIFIGGLGAGGLLLGPRADRHARPLALYAQLELIVALTAAATPLLLGVVRFIYLASGGSAALGSTVATLFRVALSAAVLAVPTIAMGGTLPAAARAATRETDDRRQDVAAVYALNTLGAVLGCIIATFWILEILGTHATIWVAAVVNAAIAAAAWLLARGFGDQPISEETSGDHGTDEVRLKPDPTRAPDPTYGADAARGGAFRPDATHAGSSSAARKKKKGRPHAAPSPLALSPPAPSHPEPSHFAPSHLAPSHLVPVWFLLLASGTVGFAFFLLELVWYRLLAPLLGGSVFTFGLVLAVALAGIGLGGLVYAVTAARRPASLSGFGWTCLLEAAAVAATFALGDRIAFLAATLLPIELIGFGARIAGWTLVTSLVVLPPALVAGYQFPLLIALFGRARERVGRQIGRAYAANTFGAIAGSLAGGFGLLPWLSAVGAWRMVAIVLLALGVAAVLISIAGHRDAAMWPVRRSVVAGQALVALVALLCVSATGPTAAWRHSGIGAGRVSPAQVFASPNRFTDWLHLMRRGIVWDGDGTESGVALMENRSGYAFIVNGKSDGSARNDAGTQIMGGLIGALTHPDVRRALVIGLGTGSTAGWLGALPDVERVDVVELEPLILEVARACMAVNHGVLENPKVRITIGDARETLLTSRDRYDLIASEPSNPYRAGIASLFTLEYYRAAADRLTDNGVFVQWVQAYEIDTPTLRTIYATLGSVFPQIETWHTNPGDIVLVASKQPRTHSAADLAQRIGEEPFRSALSYAWRTIDVHGVFAHYLANDTFARRLAEGRGTELNTDDRNIVEFRLARSVGIALTTVADIRNTAREVGASRPPLVDHDAVQWPAVDTAWLSYTVGMGSFLDTRTVGPPAEQARQSALLAYYRDDDVHAARGLWEQQTEVAREESELEMFPPRDPTEMAMLADVGAQLGSENVMPFIERLRQYRPGEADVVLAMLRLRQSRIDEAAAAVEAALEGFRTDPWTMTRFIDRAVQLAQVIGSQPAYTSRMFQALEQPFAVLASQEARLIARAELTRRLEFPAMCVDAVGTLEPHVPWTEAFLRLRRDCYQAAGHDRLSAAERDLNAFLANAVQPLITP
jgi:spermidine synthase